MRLLRRPRFLVVLALQAAALGLLATSALGTSKDGPQIASQPLISASVDVAHDTSAPLAQLPAASTDSRPAPLELERKQIATVTPQAQDPAVQSAVAGPAVPGTTVAFTGLRRTDLSASSVPPDTVGDVGPTQYVQAVNGGLSVFSKTGDNLTGAINDSSFWNGLPGCQPTSTRGLSDPTVNYDQFADRWVYAVLSFDVSTPVWQQSYMCVAVSTTGDATDSWNRYIFAAGRGVLTDYPKLGVWPDGYYISFNDFDNTTHNFVGAGAMVLQRSAMLAGGTAQSVFVDLRNVSGLLGGMLPADADGATVPPNNAPAYFVSPVDDPTDVNDQLGVWAFHVDWAVPANSTFTNPQAVGVAAFNGNTQRSVPQPGTGTLLDGLADTRLMNRLQYRNFGGYETLVTNLSVDNGTGGLAPRWFELRKAAGSWSVNQQSTFNPSSVNRWMGSVAMDGAGDIALGYTAGDASTSPELRYTGRLVSDSLSTMQAEATLAGGGGSQTGTNRWGDYSQMSVDPTDDCTFWYTGEFYPSTSATSWQTRIGSFRFPSCVTSTGPTYSVVPAVSGTLREGQTLTATAGTWSPVPTSTAYQWRRCDANSVSCVDIASATSNTYTLVAADAGRRIRVKVSVTAATGSSSIVSAATTTILPLAPVNNVLPTVVGQTQVAQTLTGGSGAWSSYPSAVTTFTYQWERCQLSCASIPGATSSSYTLVAADAGATIRLAVQGSSIGGSTWAWSAQTAAVQLPPAPVNSGAPTITGTAQAGSTLTLSTGSWTGASPITVTRQWQSCSGSGQSCSDITGQTSSTYAVNSGDVGRTVRGVVTATNSGGNAVYTTGTTAVVTAAPAGGGGGGGGGGGVGTPDLVVTGFASPATAVAGTNVTYVLTVTDKNVMPADQLYLNVTLPSGVQYVSTLVDRGTGCAQTSATTLRCFLDWLSGDALAAHLQITVKVTADGAQTMSATASAQQGDVNASDNTLAIAINSSTSPTQSAPVGLNGDGTPTKAQDKKKPAAQAMASDGRRGSVAKLRFKIYDDKGTARALTAIKRGNKVVGTANTGYGPVAYGSVYYVGWKVPANAAVGGYWFCVTAIDRAGNKSAPSCAPLTVK